MESRCCGEETCLLKQIVGYKAVDEYVHSNMVVGLGTGSTANFVIVRIGEKLRSGELSNIRAVPTSVQSCNLARSLNIKVIDLDSANHKIDVAIDGADEIDLKSLALVKGRGGALLQEKIVAKCAEKFIVVADDTKIRTDGIGGGSGPLPVEINQHFHTHIIHNILNLPAVKLAKGTALLRTQPALAKPLPPPETAKPYVTDNMNYIVDLYFQQAIQNPQSLAAEIKSIVGVVEHGLFLEMATACLICKHDGQTYKLTKN